MGLKFLEKDEKILYIAEALKMHKEAGIDIINDVFKRGKQPALIIVDLQNTFTSPDSLFGGKGASPGVLRAIDNVVEKNRILIDEVRTKGFPIIYTVAVHRADGADGGSLGVRAPLLIEYCKKDSKWVQIDQRVAPQSSDYILEKQGASAFFGTPLPGILAFNKVDTCIITGFSTSICVRQTVVDATSYGYYAVIPEECVGDKYVWTGKASLFDIATKIADVTTLEDVLGWVNGLEEA